MAITINRDFVLKTMERTTQRAMARVVEFEDPIIQNDDDIPQEEKEKLLGMMERDYAVFATICAWIEKYVPAFEESTISNKYLERSHADFTARNADTPKVDNIVNLADYRKGVVQ